MTRPNKPIVVAALIATAAVALTGCGTTVSQRIAADMSQQSEAYQAWWGQKMIYHAKANVFFDPFSRLYYWYESDQWTEGASLPSSISLRDDKPTVVTRARMLSASKNAFNVQAFNPYYTTVPTQPAFGNEAFVEADAEWQPAEGEFDFNAFVEDFIQSDEDDESITFVDSDESN
jgi:hypothetical protein